MVCHYCGSNSGSCEERGGAGGLVSMALVWMGLSWWESEAELTSVASCWSYTWGTDEDISVLCYSLCYSLCTFSMFLCLFRHLVSTSVMLSCTKWFQCLFAVFYFYFAQLATVLNLFLLSLCLQYSYIFILMFYLYIFHILHFLFLNFWTLVVYSLCTLFCMFCASTPPQIPCMVMNCILILIFRIIILSFFLMFCF